MPEAVVISIVHHHGHNKLPLNPYLYGSAVGVSMVMMVQNKHNIIRSAEKQQIYFHAHYITVEIICQGE